MRRRTSGAFSFRMRVAPVAEPIVSPNLTILQRETERQDEALLNMLERMNGDADLEDGIDSEPSLCWTRTMVVGNRDELEENRAIALQE